MGRAPCCDKDGLKKGPWLPEEDEKLIDYIQNHGPGNWRALPKKAGLQRCGKSCRLRWTNYLRPDIKRGRFTFEEEEAIIQLHIMLGNKWSAIAAKLPGRTDNEIKNYWNTHIRKRLLRMGVDPVTHTRRLDLLDLPSILNSSLQNSSQLNLLKFLGLQSLVNPDLLRLASLLSTNQNPNQNENLNFLLQNLQANQLGHGGPLQYQFLENVQTGNQIQNSIQEKNPNCSAMSTTVCTTSPYTQVYGDAQVMQPSFDQCTTTFSNFDAQTFGAQTGSLVNDEWQSSCLLNTEAAPNQCDNNVQPNDSQHISGDQPIITSALCNASGFQSNNNNQELSLSSFLSTPCTSQQTPLSSSSEYPSSSNEDEIDSYCQNLMNFDIPFDLFNMC